MKVERSASLPMQAHPEVYVKGELVGKIEDGAAARLLARPSGPHPHRRPLAPARRVDSHTPGPHNAVLLLLALEGYDETKAIKALYGKAA